MGWRGYNEQLALLPLLESGAWEVEFSSHYVASRMAAEFAGSAIAGLALHPGAFETSLWLRRV